MAYISDQWACLHKKEFCIFKDVHERALYEYKMSYYYELCMPTHYTEIHYLDVCSKIYKSVLLTVQMVNCTLSKWWVLLNDHCYLEIKSQQLDDQLQHDRMSFACRKNALLVHLKLINLHNLAFMFLPVTSYQNYCFILWNRLLKYGRKSHLGLDKWRLLLTKLINH